MRLRKIIEQYDFDTHHLAFRQIGAGMDVFSQGMEPLFLLLWWGDLAAARAGFAKVLDANKRMLARVRQGEVAAEGYGLDTFSVAVVLVTALMAAGDADTLRELMANSLLGATLDDEAARAGLMSFHDSPFGTWKTEDGHRHSRFESTLLMIRGINALLEEATDASRTALLAWLPPPAELLRIAEFETAWRAHPLGASHPALLCARLHGERLDDWAATVEVRRACWPSSRFIPCCAPRRRGCSAARMRRSELTRRRVRRRRRP